MAVPSLSTTDDNVESVKWHSFLYFTLSVDSELCSAYFEKTGRKQKEICHSSVNSLKICIK